MVKLEFSFNEKGDGGGSSRFDRQFQMLVTSSSSNFFPTKLCWKSCKQAQVPRKTKLESFRLITVLVLVLVGTECLATYPQFLHSGIRKLSERQGIILPRT
jgi:hypothetical protein